MSQRQSHHVVRWTDIRGRPSPAQCAGVEPVPLAENGVETPETLESAREGDLRHRQWRVREQALGQEEAMGLRERDW